MTCTGYIAKRERLFTLCNEANTQSGLVHPQITQVWGGDEASANLVTAPRGSHSEPGPTQKGKGARQCPLVPRGVAPAWSQD